MWIPEPHLGLAEFLKQMPQIFLVSGQGLETALAIAG